MRILEVRDGFVKIETEGKISLSSFLQINDISKRYIAQIIRVQRTEYETIAFAKILFIYDGTLKNYDKSLPDKSAEISEFTFDILSKSLEYTTPVVAGKFIDGSIDIPIDKECFNNKMLISVDNPKVNNRIISNLAKQFAHLGKTVIIDMFGIIDGQKYVAGTDFKLPLNTESLNFMYEDCLNDATSDSKSLIKEIFNDLAEYSKTVPFLPFDALKTIVDDMVDKQHIFKLLVLKNKLSKFAQQGYFAATAKDAQNLNKILEEKFVIIDLSKLDTIFQNRYLETIYSQIKNAQVFVEATNAINKKNIKNILTNASIPSVFVTHSKFKYINEIKSMFDNFIIEPTFTNNETFKIYSTFLGSMSKDTYLLVGEGTNYIPFVSSLEAVVNIPETKTIDEPVEELTEEILETQEEPEEISEPELVEEELTESEDEPIETVLETSESIFEDDEETEEEEVLQLEPEIVEEIPEETAIEEDSFSEEFHTEIDEIQTIEIPEDISDLTDEVEIEENKEVNEDLQNSFEERMAVDTDSIGLKEYSDDINNEEIEPAKPEEPAVIPLEEDNGIEALDEIVELDPSEIDDDAIIVDFEDEDEAEPLNEEDLDKQIVEDVDKVFTSIKDDSISDSDLDFIDELNNEEESLEELTIEDGSIEELSENFAEEAEEDGFLEPIQEQEELSLDSDDSDEILETRETKTPIVPVYDADIPPEDIVMSDPIEQGDMVVHAKYGNGTVEKMIKYGTKTLYSINFDNVGRRLLDPTLTEIKKA